MGVSKFVLKLRLCKDEQKSEIFWEGRYADQVRCRNRSQVQPEWLFPPYRDLPYEASAPGSWFSDEHISFFIAIFYFLLCLWIKEKDTHLPEVLKTSVLSVFLALFTCWCETHIPRKVPESENFYEILRSRTFVKFRINTGFTASCFYGTLLVAFAQIKDSYISTRCSATTALDMARLDTLNFSADFRFKGIYQ